MKLFENASLAKHNTFGIDVKAKVLIHYESVDELIELIKTKILSAPKLLHIGGGSNLLFLTDFEGTILHSDIKFIKILSENNETVLVEAGAGIEWDSFVEHCVKNGWSGVENLSLIPGEVGASAIQNIGAYGTEVCDTIKLVKAINLKNAQARVFSNNECKYAYRNSVFKQENKGEFAVTSVVFELHKKPVFNLSYQHLEEMVSRMGELTLENIRKTIISIRESKLPDPKIIGNAGSFFMNPVVSRSHFEKLLENYPTMPHYFVTESEEKIPAGWLIEQCGWKGKTIGNAGVHHNQALVLINKGNATGLEIASFAAKIQESVFTKFAIELTPEVNYIS